MFARAIQLALLVGLMSTTAVLSTASLSGCGGGQQAAPEEESSKHKNKKKKRRNHPDDKDAVSEKGKSWGGWRWKGDRDDCYFVHENRCFDSKSRACEAAKCGRKSCQVKDGAPSKVSCK